MKQCPRCQQTYSDDQLNFCLSDGELLTGYGPGPDTRGYADDAPPTVLLNQPRVTNPANWPQTPTSASPAAWQPSNMQGRPFLSQPMGKSRDQTIPTIALILGILSLPLICCYGGIWLGLPAAVLGFIGMRNADSDTDRYMGRNLAIGGMVLGLVSFLSSLVVALVAILSRQ
ncbi:hypothetical protein BH10ACI2_BH10ACI2_05190 [soil metagenome]